MDSLLERIDELEHKLNESEEIILTPEIADKIDEYETELNSLLTPLQKKFLTTCLDFQLFVLQYDILFLILFVRRTASKLSLFY